ncbi:potassium channel family protein [Cognatilysobacter bugurensis]|uniref:Ion transporter n=1 Tax=Cognatilysobacter bugurensis TaxID=543356 RepID=A0A918WAT3_9GAMM|nr:potassium channel family protein [Lysobacter bugurensis]GHA90648.1 ion transporter [Lysobacter bugurensis]
MQAADWIAQGGVAAAALVTTIVAALIHYKGMLALGEHFDRLGHIDGDKPLRQRTVLKVVAALFVLHVIEIALFGLVYWGLLLLERTGGIDGTQQFGPLDALYFSAVSFTTVGFGGLKPVGAIRFVAGAEALIGFMLITWSASFMFLHMQRHWRGGNDDDSGDNNDR